MKQPESLKQMLLKAIKARIFCDSNYKSKIQIEPRVRDGFQCKVERSSDTELREYCIREWKNISRIIPGTHAKKIKNLLFN